MLGRSFREQWRELLMGLGIGILAVVAIVLPFSVYQEKPVEWLIELYRDTLSSYAFATVNTANLYYLLAANWVSINTLLRPLLPLLTALVLAALGTAVLFGRKWEVSFLKSRNGQLSLLLYAFAAFAVLSLLAALHSPLTGMVNYGIYGYIMMAFVFAYAILLMFHDKADLPFYLALALLGVYVLGVKIHERYLFPALVMLVLAYLRKRDSRLLWLMAAASCVAFANTAIVLDNALLFGSASGHLNDDTLAVNVVLAILNVGMVGFGGYMAYTGLRETPEQAPKPEKKQEKKHI